MNIIFFRLNARNDQSSDPQYSQQPNRPTIYHKHTIEVIFQRQTGLNIIQTFKKKPLVRGFFMVLISIYIVYTEYIFLWNCNYDRAKNKNVYC